MFEHLERASLATLPTALEAGPVLEGGVRLWIKRDDLTGLGGGGNKARKLEFLCGEALARGAKALVTVGAAQSNHCRMTAAAGAKLGIEVHLVLAGDKPERASGNQLLSTLFGAQLHFTGAGESHWGELEIASEALTEQLAADGLAPYAIPVGGSTAVGALGYALAFGELLEQFEQANISPTALVFTSSSGGTHAGLLAGRALAMAAGQVVPEVVAIGVAKGVNGGLPDVAEMANEVVGLLRATDPEGQGSKDGVSAADVEVDTRWIGDDYAVPTIEGDAAISWAARRGGWLLDRTYSGKGMSGMLGLASEGRFTEGDDVVFVHTGGWPALFSPHGTPLASD
ncbi:MAG: pyridoxal-phosphate dependent enzyme [Ilumatobacteraceae bacterium]|nr:pyridoxal-phosphate dependent enzyme [Ilumatobacteraceae bacterium]